ncbi:hypothetical protein [Bradyrhizobium sp. USDA 4454]
MSPMGCVVQFPAMDQGLGCIVNNMAPLTSTILANPARRVLKSLTGSWANGPRAGTDVSAAGSVSSITDELASVSFLQKRQQSFEP